MTMMTAETPEEKKPWNKNVLKSKMHIPAAVIKIAINMNGRNADVKKITINVNAKKITITTAVDV
ncbi:hypothetical protein AS034_11595 [[Bacillus] enclensis]|uniref:Uncharacterized protein n=2 Tax=Rossellomorea TaxID=2837508 RepID=A0A0V8HK00_9BACI|nr:hypothetical protein [[Bacillus] enclensis]OAT82614.1 hypothetical protein A6P54_08710 [Bacillus sp. MKU004]QWC24730.1 hypothetical protein KJK41_10650 [Bacillus haikouensis]KSU62744.1 hypothetical protein AS034_11595 [[Bacillus] enclensis]MBH9965212.1 hypothetical protein [[Bacillus] enclensis]SCC08880.1 hypothetical protein GA0061094_2403 [[Bacillus] enclensis]